ncbi:uncharacterized protein DDB_G0286379-like [Dreissena polymorpha]|uniref:Uncharacterized protein n=1 Tax=Dreissena polymorpha TaxID=45954 RepID=A0A9D4N9L2_DREPO|nr:uncharacterized protein DDB_G0286379-like [Dreissena polymorpha]KAH3889749.1 hypothetical protein DPMN_013811 [Dreissena polymorpha]
MSSDPTAPPAPGVEDGEEFDDPRKAGMLYCTPLSVLEFEEQAEKETEKAINELMGYLDGHKEQFTDLLRKKKRQDLENGGLISFVRVKVCDIIHGNNSPLLRVTEKERDQKLDELKRNMTKAFEYSLETKGRRVSKRLEEKKQKGFDASNGKVPNDKAAAGQQKTRGTMAPPPPPPPPPIPGENALTTTPKGLSLSRKPFTPIENRIQEFKTPQTFKTRKLDDILGATPSVDTSLTSLHEELMSSNPWKRLKCVGENRSPGGTPMAAKRSNSNIPSEPLHIALVNKFKNVRSPSPNTSLNVTANSLEGFTP